MANNGYERGKYNYHDWKHNYREPLPSDINQMVIDKVARLESTELVALIRGVEEKRLFGKLLVYDANMFLVAEIHFDGGICRKFDLVDDRSVEKLTLPVRPILIRSIRNDVVSYKRTGKAENE